VSQLLSRHVHLLSQDKVKDEDIEEAKNSMLNILGEVTDRITILRRIWMRQRQDVEVQVRYYVNGLFQDYYKVSSSLVLHLFVAIGIRTMNGGRTMPVARTPAMGKALQCTPTTSSK